MDLIAMIATQTGLPAEHAQALAGTVLGTVKASVADEVGAEEAKKMDQAVPELDGWMSQAKALLSEDEAEPEAGSSFFGSVMGAAGSGVGNQLLGAVAGKEAQQTATIVALAGKIGISSQQAMVAAPLALNFLKERIGDEWLEKALKVAPILAGIEEEKQPSAADSVVGALGNLFGGK